jgi:phage protein D
MTLAESQILDGIQSLKDRYVPRFEVFVAKPVLSRNPPGGGPGGLGGGPPPVPVDPDTATAAERERLDSNVFVSTGEIGAPPPKLSQLVPLAGPWGEKADQHTDDILSVEFSESIEKQQLAKVTVELLNVYDFVRQFYRYTDIPPSLSGDQAGVFPIIEYGDTLALRFGYGTDIQWMFEGIVTTVEASFPADGESIVTLTAVDKRDRLRSQKKVDVAAVANATVEQIIGQIAALAGLQIAAPEGQATTSDSSANRRPADQDALQYITDRANRGTLELLCFGDTLYALKPADDAKSAIRYIYRAGLTSFKPTFNGVGKPSQVQVVSRDPVTGLPVDVTVKTSDLQDMGLVPASDDQVGTDTVAQAGQAGDKTEVVTNYLALSTDQAKRLAAGILKRNVDAAITASGEVIGDPRIRPRVTLKIDGVGRYNGLYYVISASHKLGPNGYQTSFTARRNGALSADGAAAGNGSSGGGSSSGGNGQGGG